MKKLISLFSMLFLVVTIAFSQRDVSGVVQDDAGNPIPGASIIVLGTSNGTVTDIDGKFSINVSSDDQLEISFVGYETQLVSVGAQSMMVITLSEGTEFLDEIVVSGYSTQTRKSQTGAVSSVDVDGAVKRSVVNAAELLQGTAAGVQVIASGQPGSAPLVRIRGFATPNDNNPLYIIDGVQTDDPFVANSISASDIDQINVLKDGAAAIYGARASNGVIVITTKNGYYNQENTVSFETYVGTTNATNLPTLLNAQQHGEMIWQSKINDGVSPNHPQYGTGGSPIVPSKLQGVPVSATVSPNGTDWLDAIFDPGLAQQYKVTVTSGGAASKFMMSMEYVDREGAQIMTGYTVGRTRMNGEFKVNENIRVGQHLNVSFDSEKVGNQLEGAYRSSPLIPLRDDDGNFAGTYVASAGLGNMNNPYANHMRTQDNFQKSLRVFGDIYASAVLFKGLEYKVVAGGLMRSFNNRRFNELDPEHGEARSVNTLYEQSFNEYNWNLTNTLRYQNTFGSHSVDALLGYEALKKSFKGHEISRNEYLFEDPNFYLLSNGAGTPVVQYASESGYTINSSFLTVNYGYSDKYLVTATVRQDNTSRFAKANANAVFPSGSIGWVISEEDFFNSRSYLKLRVSYGTLGNQSLGRTAPDQNVSSLSEANAYYPFGGNEGSIATGAALSSVGNPNLKWETNVSQNIGLDFRLVSDKLYGSVDYYSRKTKDLIAVDNSLIGTTAIDASAPLVNIGEITNSGIELSLNYADETTGGLGYDVGLNFSKNKNMVDSLISAFYTGATWYRGGAVTRTSAGEAMSYFYGRQVKGLDSNGRFEYEDINGDGQINDDDRTKIGSPHPDFIFGLSLNLAYKNFDLFATLNGSIGNEVYHYNKIYSHFPTFFNGNRHADVLDSWTPTNTDTDMPALSETISNAETQPNSWFVEDASYVKVRTIQLGYTLPSKAASKLGISNARIYVSGNNLFTFSGYSGMDPEIGGYALNLGVDAAEYPIAVMTTIGLNVTF
tara:strand:+ start:656 stop:3673 length:3018 start_codon:yes stop_codon:yes gene_type:complete